MQVSPGPWDSPAVVMRSADMAPKITGGGAGSRWRCGLGWAAVAPAGRSRLRGGAVAPTWRGAGGRNLQPPRPPATHGRHEHVTDL